MIKNPLLKFLFIISFIFSIITTKIFDLDKLLILSFLLSIFIFTYKIGFKNYLKKLLTLTPFILSFSIMLIFIKKETILEINFFNFVYFYLPLNILNFISIFSKSILSIALAITFIETTNFTQLICSLKFLKLPKELLNTILLIYRYFYVLLDEIKRMEIARDIRYFGGYFKRQIKVYSNIIGVLLLRSIEKSEKVYNAMKLRGYNGDISYIIDLKYEKKEIIIFIIFIIIFLTFKVI
ncbi:MAG: energy-coupling factor transporter transmembrane protein EcfT [Caldisericia bacterium]|nr:energy-coupling factor transporter transmembrane protein EcfT [Caldisericia bacterium]